MAWSSGNLGVTAAVLCLFTTMSGAVQIDDCQGGYIYITNDTSSPSTIKCSGVAPSGTVSWFIEKNSQVTWVAVCSSAACTPNIPEVEAQWFPNSGYSILRITQNHQQVAGGDAVVSCQTSTDNAFCTIRIIDRLPSIAVYGAEHPLYAGELAYLSCGVSLTESPPSIHITYTWMWSRGGAISCSHDVTASFVCQFYLTPQHNKEGVVCAISYTSYNTLPGKTTTVTLNVRYPPPQAPVITGNREVSVGQSLTLECRVYSGNPLVTAVIFYCGLGKDDFDTRVPSTTDDTSYVSSKVTIQSVKTSDNGVTCVCSGNWETPVLYADRSSVTLTVSGVVTASSSVTIAGTATHTPSVPTNADELSGDPTNAGAIAGGVVGAVVVIAVVVVVLVFIIKRRNSRPKPPPASRRDPLYDTEEHINPVYGTDDPATNHSDIYGGGGAADDTIPDIGYSAVGNGAQPQNPLDTQYAVVNKSRKNQPPTGTTQPQDEYSVVDKSRKNQPPAPTQDEYAVVDKSRKNQPSAPTQDEYAVVDKSRMKPAAKPKPGAKP